MSTPITPTKAQIDLALSLSTNDTWKRAQAIAESEARAVNTALKHAIIEIESYREAALYDRTHPEGVDAQRDQLRAEVERLKADLIEQGKRVTKAQDELEASILRTADQRTRADCLQREVDRWQEWRDRQPWVNEIIGYSQQITTLSAENTKLREEVGRLAPRLQADPGGSDKIDELESALSLIRARAECAELSHVREQARAIEARSDATKARAELAAFRTLIVRVTPGENGEGTESEVSPEDIREYIQYLQAEWDGAEIRIAKLNEELAEARETSEQHCAKRIENLTGLLNYKGQVTILRKALEEIAGYDKDSPHGPGICDYGCDTPQIARNVLDKTRPVA